jgi:hypothetical protein
LSIYLDMINWLQEKLQIFDLELVEDKITQIHDYEFNYRLYISKSESLRIFIWKTIKGKDIVKVNIDRGIGFDEFSKTIYTHQLEIPHILEFLSLKNNLNELQMGFVVEYLEQKIKEYNSFVKHKNYNMFQVESLCSDFSLIEKIIEKNSNLKVVKLLKILNNYEQIIHIREQGQ